MKKYILQLLIGICILVGFTFTVPNVNAMIINMPMCKHLDLEKITLDKDMFKSKLSEKITTDHVTKVKVSPAVPKDKISIPLNAHNTIQGYVDLDPNDQAPTFFIVPDTSVKEVFLPADCSGLFNIDNNILTEINLQKVNTSNVLNMSYMFAGCKEIVSLDLSSFNVRKVNDMEGMFSGCEKLTALNLSSFRTGSVTNMSGMFSSCMELTHLDLSNFNTQNVTHMYHMFSYCIKLTELNISNFDTRRVEDMSYMFHVCENLTSLDLSTFNTTKTLNMSGMFSYCKMLMRLNISSFNTTRVSDMSKMFERCESLTSLNISNFDTKRTRHMAFMFKNCKKLEDLKLPDDHSRFLCPWQDIFSKCPFQATIDAYKKQNPNTSPRIMV